MKDLHPQYEKLLAYSDNKLNDADRSEIEDLLNEDTSAVEFLEQLSVSDLPFKDSFDFLLDESSHSQPQVDVDVLKLSTSQSTKKERINYKWPASLAASLFMGLVLGYFGLKTSNENHDNWIVQVADYHLLYVRETVKSSILTATEKSYLRNKLGARLDTQLVIPNLKAQNMQFKRGQLLDSNGKVLVQLAYLPKTGRPVALCILRNEASDSLPKAGQSRGLPYVTWAKDGLSYVIIGDVDKQDLHAAALSALSQMTNTTI